MEVIKQGLISIQNISQNLKEILENSEDPNVLSLSGLLMDIQSVEPALNSAIEILELNSKSLPNRHSSMLVSQDTPPYELISDLNNLDIRLKENESKLLQKEAMIDYLSHISNAKNAVIKKYTYKYHEAASELRLARTDYARIMEQNEELDRENTKIKSDLLSMRASLSYYDPIRIDDTEKLEEEVQNLKKRIEDEKASKIELIEKLNSDIHFKNVYIDQLVCQVENLHQLSNYNKDKFADFEEILDKTLKELANERGNRSASQKEMLIAQNELALCQKTLQEVNHKLKEHMVETEAMKRHLVYDLKVKHKKEINKVREGNENQLKTQEILYENKVHLLQKQYQDTLKSFVEFGISKSQEIRQFYQDRIDSLIREYSRQEAVYFSEIQKLSQQITQAKDNEHTLYNKINVIEFDKQATSDEINEKLEIIVGLNSKLHTCEYDLAAKQAECKAQYSMIETHILKFKEEIKQQFEHQNKLILNRERETVAILHRQSTDQDLRLKSEIREQARKFENLRNLERQTFIEEIRKIEKLRLEQANNSNQKLTQVENEYSLQIESLLNKIEEEKDELMLHIEQEKHSLHTTHQHEISLVIETKDNEKAIELKAAEQAYLEELQKIQLQNQEEIKNSMKNGTSTKLYSATS